MYLFNSALNEVVLCQRERPWGAYDHMSFHLNVSTDLPLSVILLLPIPLHTASLYHRYSQDTQRIFLWYLHTLSCAPTPLVLQASRPQNSLTLNTSFWISVRGLALQLRIVISRSFHLQRFDLRAKTFTQIISNAWSTPWDPFIAGFKVFYSSYPLRAIPRANAVFQTWDPFNHQQR